MTRRGTDRAVSFVHTRLSFTEGIAVNIEMVATQQTTEELARIHNLLHRKKKTKAAVG